MTTVIIIVAVVVVLAVAAAAYVTSRRRTEQRREHAAHLRQEAEARAEVARTEAERAEQEAAEARQGLDMEEARHEDVVRRAAALDPDVDHRATGYQPGATRSRDT